jgi:ubiquinone/menaquinone biosynthesis C-methylase UbiE
VRPQDEPGEQLIAYVVTRLPAGGSMPDDPRVTGTAIVDHWGKLYELAYARAPAAPSFAGWTSSYTRQPIPQPQMQEWLETTLARIRRLKPNRILEIGCGVGLLLQQLAPHCAVYVGTDISAAALAKLRQWSNQHDGLQHIELLNCSAAELQGLGSGRFDTVILNSVVQYFPDVDYLVAVLKESMRLLQPGGTIFIGDVRHLGLLSTFHSSIQLQKALDTVTAAQLRRRIARAVTQETELLLEPRLFEALAARMPGIAAVEIQLRRGKSHNEMTRYRFDVAIQVGAETRAPVSCESLDWQTTAVSVDEMKALLSTRRWPSVRLHSIPNLRLAREQAARRVIESAAGQTTVGELRRQLNELQVHGIDPEELSECAESLGYDVSIEWGPSTAPEYFAALLLDRSRADQVGRMQSTPPARTGSWSELANDPLRNRMEQQLIPQLHRYIEEQLPGHVMPSAWTVLRQLPLTSDGQVDRCQL